MSLDTNCTVTFKWPLPEKAKKTLGPFLHGLGFADDWDARPINLRSKEDVQHLLPGILRLFARNVGYEEAQQILAMGKANKISIIVHSEWWNDYECDVVGTIIAYDSTDGRVIDVPATCQTMEPLVPLNEALALTHGELRKRFSLPKDL